VYPWSVGSGFGTKYTNPATLPTGIGQSVAFSPAGNAIAVAHNTSPFITAYPWSVGSGFGTKYADPATLPTGNGQSVAFSPAGDAVAVAHNTATPYITAYPWTVGSGFGTKYTNPATLPTNVADSVAFTPAANAIVVGHFGGNGITAYQWSASGFGTKYTDTIAPNRIFSIAFNTAGNVAALAGNTSPYVFAYTWTTSTGFGTKYADPATLPTGSGTGVAFLPTI
jgi:hypothetical protein